MQAQTRQRIQKLRGAGLLNDEESAFLRVLMEAGQGRPGNPVGREAAVSAEVLAMELATVSSGRTLAEDLEDGGKRRVRRVFNQLTIKYKLPLCSEAGRGGGYYIAASDSEVEANYARFHKRAMTGLMKATRARKGAYADAMIQLTMGFDGAIGDEIRQKMGVTRSTSERNAPPAWVSVVTKLLERMESDPQQYADQIRELQERFGDIFVPRDRVRRIRELTTALQAQLEGLE